MDQHGHRSDRKELKTIQKRIRTVVLLLNFLLNEDRITKGDFIEKFNFKGIFIKRIFNLMKRYRQTAISCRNLIEELFF
ncbi:hypothetical protein LEP1GSC021_3661 [Leptospira noguchii str. 1993005606]|uniref:Uncharacterized protein n=1 Tax=Leptospira noguchii str. 2001034031 TaxID=1193053 RepID=M6YKP3_9LEPT|nr:hypothetical protein LEP1GSC024_4731 [Leptospira noguchii str. 2001034031]EPE82551.1 hypothetical protein LEP1GSC021_3661 [Leptospira noguchii str. 1993005606]